MKFAKPKYKKQKSKHISNPRITEHIECEICGINSATETHELRGGSYRNNSIAIGFQLKLCKTCHDNWHLHYSKEHKNVIRAIKQRELLARGLSKEEFMKNIERNYL